MICVYEVAGNVIETYEQVAEFGEHRTATRDFRSRHLDTFSANLVVLWQ